MENKITQQNIPENWNSKTLGDFLEKMEGGGTPSKENPEFWNGSIPWASVKDVVTHNPYETQDHISEKGLRNSSSRIVPKGTLIVPTRMALGHAVVFKVDVAINQDLKALYPKKDLLNEYLFHWFNSKKVFIEKLGSGSTVSGIQQNELKKIKFNLPPLPEQIRIIAVLETWDQAINKLKRKIEVKKEVQKGLMHNLFAGKKRLPGFAGALKECRLGEVASLITKGTTPTTNGFKYQDHGVKFIKIESISDSGHILNNKCAYISEEANVSLKRSQLNDGDILFSIAGALGRMVMIDKSHLPANTNQALAIIRLSNEDKVSRDFIYLYLQSNKVKSWIKEINVQMAQANISLSNVANLKMHIPDLNEQEAIADILKTATNEIERLKEKLFLLKDQKKYLLNNLVTGAIRTPELLSIPK